MSRQAIIAAAVGVAFLTGSSSDALGASASEAELKLLRQAHARDVARIRELTERLRQLEKPGGSPPAEATGKPPGARPRPQTPQDVVTEMEKSLKATRDHALRTLEKMAADRRAKGDDPGLLAVFKAILEIAPKHRAALAAISRASPPREAANRRFKIPSHLEWREMRKSPKDANGVVFSEAHLLRMPSKTRAEDLCPPILRFLAKGDLKSTLGGGRFVLVALQDFKFPGCPPDRPFYVAYLLSEEGGKFRLELLNGPFFVDGKAVPNGAVLSLRKGKVHVLLMVKGHLGLGLRVRLFPHGETTIKEGVVPVAKK